jgi:hypothetical protein
MNNESADDCWVGAKWVSFHLLFCTNLNDKIYLLFSHSRSSYGDMVRFILHFMIIDPYYYAKFISLSLSIFFIIKWKMSIVSPYESAIQKMNNY